MGLFKGMKDIAGLTKEAKKLQEQQLARGRGDHQPRGPARGAQWFNLEIDMEIHIPGRQPYRINNQYMVPAGATLGPGVTLPVRVDRDNPAKIAIDWDSAQQAPAPGEVRPVGDASRSPPASTTPASVPRGGQGGARARRQGRAGAS